MKNTWDDMSRKVEKKEIITKKYLENMTQKKYHSKLNKIKSSEYVGTLVCYMGATYLILNFTKIEDVLIQIFAVLTIFLLFALPVISLKSVRAVKNANIASKTYIEVLNDFGKRKIKFQKLQKLNVAFGLFLLLVGPSVMAAIKGKDLSQIPHFWTVIFPVAIVFFIGFSFWVLRSYDKILSETEEMLSDINS